LLTLKLILANKKYINNSKAANKNLRLRTVRVLTPLLYNSFANIGIKPKAADDSRAYIIP
jgi:hypothetical protein